MIKNSFWYEVARMKKWGRTPMKYPDTHSTHWKLDPTLERSVNIHMTSMPHFNVANDKIRQNCNNIL